MADTSGEAGLQFDQAEVNELGGGSVACAFCLQPIPAEYHQVNQLTACGACRQKVEDTLARRPGLAGFLKASGAGFVAAAAGSLVWFLIARFAHMELGIIAIAVGYAVGYAVRWGTQGRGGWLYQLLAIALTYLAIVTSYMPDIADGFVQSSRDSGAGVAQAQPGGGADQAVPEGGDGAAASPRLALQSVGDIPALLWVLIFIVACAAPFLAGASNFMGWSIIGIALFDAGKINKRAAARITGPYAVSAAVSPAAVAAAPGA
jgi:hypothetical protein